MIRFQIHPVILCGGSGTRLWPRSRAGKPKPFLPLIGAATLFQATLGRADLAHGFAAPIVVTGARQLAHVVEQTRPTSDATIVVEPSARNTAAAIALAALLLPGDAIMLVCPSDHHIADEAAFRTAAHQAAALANDGFLVSFGIEATRPETGYGYLERGEPLGHGGFRVARFVEKPGLAAAESYLASGRFAWNGGIFAFRVSDFLAELEAHAPDIAQAARAAVAGGRREGRCFHPGAEQFGGFKALSVDYAVMENTRKAAMVPVDMGWSDIGSWDALHAALPQDAAGNSVQGVAELVECRNVFVSSDGPRVSAIGLEDVVIVVDGNEVLVTSKAGSQLVGKLNGVTDQ